jgi:5'-methylthioadenosine phosphorylase
VTVEQVVAVLNKNAENACDVVRHAVALMPKQHSCKCHQALAMAIMTDRSKIPAATLERLMPIVGKYFGQKVGA